MDYIVFAIGSSPAPSLSQDAILAVSSVLDGADIVPVGYAFTCGDGDAIRIESGMSGFAAADRAIEELGIRLLDMPGAGTAILIDAEGIGEADLDFLARKAKKHSRVPVLLNSKGAVTRLA